MVARGEVGWGLGEQAEGTEKYGLVVQNSHGDVKYRQGIQSIIL